MRARNELNALGGHQIGAALNHSLFQLHVGNPVHQETTNPVGSFKDGNPVTCAIKLGRAGEAGWTRADHGDLFAGTYRRRFGNHPARLKTFVNYRLLNRLDSNREITNTQYTRTFAWRGTNSAGKFRKVVGVVKATQGFAPMTPIDQIVPFGYQIVYRAPGSGTADHSTGMTKRNATIHATSALFAQGFLRRVEMEFLPVGDALRW